VGWTKGLLCVRWAVAGNALVDSEPGVKRSKVKVTRLSIALRVWIMQVDSQVSSCNNACTLSDDGAQSSWRRLRRVFTQRERGTENVLHFPVSRFQCRVSESLAHNSRSSLQVCNVGA